MAYAEISDILANFKSLEVQASGTAVTTSELTEILFQESNYIDAKIGTRYLTPIDPSNIEAFSVLKRICIFRASERVKNILEVKTGITQKDSEEKFTKNYVETPNYDLDQISKGLMVLLGAELISSQVGFSSFNVSTGYANKFNVNKQQW